MALDLHATLLTVVLHLDQPVEVVVGRRGVLAARAATRGPMYLLLAAHAAIL